MTLTAAGMARSLCPPPDARQAATVCGARPSVEPGPALKPLNKASVAPATVFAQRGYRLAWAAGTDSQMDLRESSVLRAVARGAVPLWFSGCPEEETLPQTASSTGLMTNFPFLLEATSVPAVRGPSDLGLGVAWADLQPSDFV